ncbi:hypothetical protein NQ315_013374 [Exocentrus adspersus]|uniref:Uncharacterized protein n=1 Tax=Exocentrus adspersus TaxID=1586481 RepID=A0AAV8VS08_9CUCU|nr:hypothetical protein NQ315_013374 [Exocentrus adspersus]
MDCVGNENDAIDSNVLCTTNENCTKEESDKLLTKSSECENSVTELKEDMSNDLNSAQDFIEVKEKVAQEPYLRFLVSPTETPEPPKTNENETHCTG